MNKKAKAKSLNKGFMFVMAGLACIAMIAIIYAAFKFGSVQETGLETDQIEKGQVESSEGFYGDLPFTQADVEFNAIERASSAQDADDDLDIDVLLWDEDKNSDLVDKHYIDCSGATPAMFNGKDLHTEVTDENMCEVNIYKFWQSFTAGDSETKLAEKLTKVASDLDDVDGSGTTSFVANVGTTYLVTLTEGADADEDDVIPMAFLIELPLYSIYEAEDFHDGSVDIRYNIEYFSDATAASKIQISGSCEDDEDNEVNLDSTLAGFVSSSLTTATTITTECEIEVKVTDEGYALKLENPLANSKSEQAYLQIDPYGTNSTGTWVEYGAAGLTGDVAHNAPGTAANSSIIWEGLTVCGQVITDDSGTDAVKLGGEKIYQEDASCLKDTFHTGGSDPIMTIPLTVNEIKVDYDAAVDGDNGQLDYASGSSPEVVADINMVGLEATTDIVAQTLG